MLADQNIVVLKPAQRLFLIVACHILTTPLVLLSVAVVFFGMAMCGSVDHRAFVSCFQGHAEIYSFYTVIEHHDQ